MNRLFRYSIFTDIVSIAFSFSFFTWLKPDSFKRYIPEDLIPFLIYLGIGILVSFYFKKYNFKNKKKYFDFVLPVFKTNFVTIGIVSIIMYLFRLYGFSRMIVFGTLGLSTLLQILIFTLIYYTVSSENVLSVIEKGDVLPTELEQDFWETQDLTEVEREIEILEKVKLPEERELSKNGEFNKNLIIKEFGEKVYNFLNRFLDFSNTKNIFLEATTPFNVEKINPQNCNNIVNLNRINDYRRINKILEVANSKLPKGGLFIGCVETKELRKKRILREPPVLAQIHYFIDYLIKRVWPKLPLFKKIYFFITKGRNRVISKAETIGRLFSCGFKFVADTTINNMLFFVAEKVNKPVFDYHASYGPIFKMRRIGKDGKEIHVFKMRTMYPYSEYIQEYVYHRSKLKEGGKFNRDFRITTMGKFFRRFWIDELPMLLNWFIGDLKLVGVRPLSKHYLSLYTKELCEKRSQYKPGLIPPFYADMPKTLDEIMESEMKYFESYDKKPIRTDIKYFFKAWYNIVFKNARSR